MTETLVGYCLPINRMNEIRRPSVITLRNGRKAVVGQCKGAPQYKVFRTVSDSKARELEASLAQA